MKNYFFRFMKMIMPKTEIEKILDEIDQLKNDRDNYIKIAMMYSKLQNIHGLLIGKGGCDKLNFFLADFYGKQHKIYRELAYNI